jgi:hypothetical protein
MKNNHFQCHNVEHSVYNGYCEVINGHSHPILCVITIDFEELRYWVTIEIFDINLEGEEHCHSCFVEISKMKYFIEKEFINIETEEDDTGHVHKIYIDLKEKQVQTNNPITILNQR